MISGSNTEDVTDKGKPWGGVFVEHPEPHDVINDSTLPHYNKDLNACAEFEKVAKERGLEDEYEHAIIAACGKPVGTRSYAARTFATATATPVQRVKAVLAVIKEQKEEPQL